jgi:purine-binding chemotaxis protein CheW
MEQTAKGRVRAGADLRQFIGFTVGTEEYGLELLRVREVIRVREITWLPRAPSFVKGIINLRGDVIPIVDLRDKLGLPVRPADADTRIIVVEIEARLIGMVVDSASQVVRIPAAQIDPPPLLLGGLPQEYISGVGKLDDRLVTIVNVDRVLSGEERIALQRMDLPGETPDQAAPAVDGPSGQDAGP